MTNISEVDFVRLEQERERMRQDIEHWRGHAERLRQDCEFHLAEIDRLKAITWAQAGEIDRLAAENYRLTNNVAALQNRLYLNKLPHELSEDTEK
jgi:hypothetical protein